MKSGGLHEILQTLFTQKQANKNLYHLLISIDKTLKLPRIIKQYLTRDTHPTINSEILKNQNNSGMIVFVSNILRQIKLSSNSF